MIGGSSGSGGSSKIEGSVVVLILNTALTLIFAIAARRSRGQASGRASQGWTGALEYGLPPAGRPICSGPSLLEQPAGDDLINLPWSNPWKLIVVDAGSSGQICDSPALPHHLPIVVGLAHRLWSYPLTDYGLGYLPIMVP